MAAILMKSDFVFKNRILKGLPQKETRVILPHLRQIWLPKDQVLSEAGERVRDVLFPDEALISYMAGTSDGESIEVCVVGNEGAVDLGALLSHRTAFRTVVQIPGQYVIHRHPQKGIRALRCGPCRSAALHRRFVGSACADCRLQSVPLHRSASLPMAADGQR
jgi:hypothetical protein